MLLPRPDPLPLVTNSFGPLYPDLAMQAIPLLIAVFVGVRLAGREAEAGTAAFAWTQGYSKTRWLQPAIR